MMMLVETTFMFSLHLSSFSALSLYMNSFLLSHILMTVSVVFEQLGIFGLCLDSCLCLNDDVALYS